MTANESAQRGVRKGARKGRQHEIHNVVLLKQRPRVFMHVSTCFINSRGEIAGLGMTSTDEFLAYQARPAQQEDPNQQRQRPFIQ